MRFDVLWVEGLVCLVLAALAEARGKRGQYWGWTLAAFVTWARAIGWLP